MFSPYARRKNHRKKNKKEEFEIKNDERGWVYYGQSQSQKLFIDFVTGKYKPKIKARQLNKEKAND